MSYGRLTSVFLRYARVPDRTFTGRGGGIRTPDPLLPKQLRYQAALHPEGPIITFILSQLKQAPPCGACLQFGAPGEITSGILPSALRARCAARSLVQNRSRRFCRTPGRSNRRVYKIGYSPRGGGCIRFGAPGEIRTPDRLVRSQVLYPAELRAHIPKIGSTACLRRPRIILVSSTMCQPNRSISRSCNISA